MLDEKLRELLDFAKATDLQEMAWEKDGKKISFRRSDIKHQAPKSANGSSAAATNGNEPPVPKTLYIRSTMVGTFFRSESAERPPLVVEGTAVNAGQTVASIEAMKIRKDVLSQMSCRILRALVENAHAVEYGQPLFEVEPVEAGEENV
jgi:biotin carboxyl carrier protein